MSRALNRPSVPYLDLARAAAEGGEALETALLACVRRGNYVLGDEVAAFEREWGAFCGAPFAVSCASGTDAITLALAGLGIGIGDEVLTVSMTCAPSAVGIQRAGATPVFVDVEADRLTMNPALLESALTARTKAIVPVHLYGRVADMERILAFAKANGLLLVEDCAQAHGAMLGGRLAGSFGDAAAWSFYPTKNLGALGDGGTVTTARPDVAGKIRKLRLYGYATRNDADVAGFNSRLDELQAAVLRVKLRHLPRLVSARRAIAAVYSAEIRSPEVAHPGAYDGVEHSFHLYVVRATHRDALAEHLHKCGVATAVHYPAPIHRQPAYSALCVSRAMPETERAAAEILSLPLFAAMSTEAIEQVVDAVNSLSSFPRTVSV